MKKKFSNTQLILTIMKYGYKNKMAAFGFDKHDNTIVIAEKNYDVFTVTIKFVNDHIMFLLRYGNRICSIILLKLLTESDLEYYLNLYDNQVLTSVKGE